MELAGRGPVGKFQARCEMEFKCPPRWKPYPSSQRVFLRTIDSNEATEGEDDVG